MTESTDTSITTSQLPPPELPTEAPLSNPKTEAKPSGYEAVSGPSKPVSTARHNPLNDASKQIETVTKTKEPKQFETVPKTKEPKQFETETEATPTVTDIKQQHHQFQHQLLIQQQMARAAAARTVNPMLHNVHNVQNVRNTKNTNKYIRWPPVEQQQYMSFHPLGWPIDADYQYQISNYLGPTTLSAANTASTIGLNHMMAQMQSQNALHLGLNPLIAAQAAVGGNPLSLLAAQAAAFNPLLNAAHNMNTHINPSSSAVGSIPVPTPPIGTNTTMNGINSMNGHGFPVSSAAVNASIGSMGLSGGKQYSLFVFHLPEDIDDHGLLQLFAPYGAMRSNVMRHDTGRSRGFGFVHFNTRHEAHVGMDMMNGHQIGRKRLRVSFKREEPQRLNGNDIANGMMQMNTNDHQLNE